MKYFYRKGIFLFLTWLFAMNIAATAANRYWVFKNFYDNDFSTPAKIADWMLVEDDGTGGFASSGHGTAILTMDDAAGSFANRLFNINGGSPRFVPLDKVFGQVALNVIATSGGNQRFFIQAQEFDASNTYLGQVDILPAQNTTGFFSVNLSTIIWDPATVSIRFIIGGENFSGQQGTVEFAYFSYSTSNNSWNNPANWSAISNGPGGAGVPGAGDIAIFDGAGGNNGSPLIDANIVVGGWQITSGYLNDINLQGFQVTVGASGVNIAGGGISQGTNNISIAGDLTISGGVYTNLSGTAFVQGNVLVTGGTVSPSTITLDINGTLDQSVSFAAGLNLHQLIVDKTGGNLNLNSALSVADILNMSQGNINTNGFALTLGFNAMFPGVLTYTAGRINGLFQRWVSASQTGNLLFPMGNAIANAPFNVIVVTAPGTGGTITLQYNDAAPGFSPAVFIDNGTPIDAISASSWTVQQTGLTGGNFSLAASNDHVTGINDFTLLHMTLMNGVVGTHQPGTGTNADPTVNRTAIDAGTLAQTFFIGAASTALPVKFDYFAALNTGAGTEWKWTVSDEENLSYYEPQYATDGFTFLPAGKIMASNRAASQNYSFTKQIFNADKLYCRIKTVDIDGKYNYSRIVLINEAQVNTLQVWPNPARSILYIQFPVMISSNVTIVLINNQGQVCLTKDIGSNTSVVFDLSFLVRGVYFLKAVDGDGNLIGIRQIILAN